MPPETAGGQTPASASRSGGRKGLFNNILGSVRPAAGAVPSVVPTSEVRPRADQPRRHFAPGPMAELVRSVREVGVLEPLLVRPVAGGYEVMAGERRYRAAQEAGLEELPVLVREAGDAEAQQFALVENLQREDLNAAEETEAILELLSLRLGRDRGSVVSLLYAIDNARRGRSKEAPPPADVEEIEAVFAGLQKMGVPSFIKNRLPLLRLPEDLVRAMREEGLEYGKARLASRVEDAGKRAKLVREILDSGLSTREVRRRVEEILGTAEDRAAETKKVTVGLGNREREFLVEYARERDTDSGRVVATLLEILRDDRDLDELVAQRLSETGR